MRQKPPIKMEVCRYETRLRGLDSKGRNGLPAIACLLCLYTATCGCGAVREVGKERFVARHADAALAALRHDDGQTAVSELRLVLKVKPQHREARELLRIVPLAAARRAYRQGRWSEAAALWAQVGLDRLPLNEAFDFADAYDRSGDVQKAEKVYAELVRRYPDDPLAYNAQGYFYAQHGIKLDESVRLLQKSLSLIPARNREAKGAVLDSLGWAYYKQGELKLALPTIKDARELVPYHPEILYHLGVIYRALRHNDDARRELERALNLLPYVALPLPLTRSLDADIRAELQRLGVTPSTRSGGWRGFVRKLLGAGAF